MEPLQQPITPVLPTFAVLVEVVSDVLRHWHLGFQEQMDALLQENADLKAQLEG